MLASPVPPLAQKHQNFFSRRSLRENNNTSDGSARSSQTAIQRFRNSVSERPSDSTSAESARKNTGRVCSFSNEAAPDVQHHHNGGHHLPSLQHQHGPGGRKLKSLGKKVIMMIRVKRTMTGEDRAKVIRLLLEKYASTSRADDYRPGQPEQDT